MISQVEPTVKRLEKDVDDLRKHVEERISSSPESIVKARSNPDASIKRHCQMNEKVMSEHSVKTISGRTIEDPPIARFLFGDTRLSAVWLFARE